MSKAAMKRHADLRSKVAAILIGAGGRITVDDKDSLEIRLFTPRIGSLNFTMFKGDGRESKRPYDDVYSVFCQLPTKEQIEEHAPQVNLVFGQGVHLVMNPHSGKWNIHEGDAAGVLSELEKRMIWLMQGFTPRKVFYTRDNIGKAKYTINHHDGVQTNKDGSPFFGITICKNKKEFKKKMDKFFAEGYRELTSFYSFMSNS